MTCFIDKDTYWVSPDMLPKSYGIGVDIGIGSNVALNIEYIRYLDKSEFDLDAVAVGAVFSF